MKICRNSPRNSFFIYVSYFAHITYNLEANSDDHYVARYSCVIADSVAKKIKNFGMKLYLRDLSLGQTTYFGL